MTLPVLHLSLQLRTRNREELLEITGEIEAALLRAGVEDGLCTLFVPHTTAAVTVNEHADPDVQRDVVTHLRTLVPRNGAYEHVEGNSDAHIKASLIGPSLTLPVERGRLALGTWQGVFFCEFDGPRSRRVELYVISAQPPHPNQHEVTP